MLAAPATGRNACLGAHGEHRLFDTQAPGRLMEREQRLRIKVAVARFIRDPQQSVRRRVGVGERLSEYPP